MLCARRPLAAVGTSRTPRSSRGVARPPWRLQYNDYDYVNASPCNNLDLDGRKARRSGWLQRQCHQNRVLKGFRGFFGVGGFQEQLFVLSEFASSARNFLRHKPWRRTTTRAILVRAASRAGARAFGPVSYAAMAVASGGQLICKIGTGRA